MEETMGKSKNLLKVFKFAQSRPDALVNTLTPGLVQHHLTRPLCASYLRSCSAGLTLRKYPCYNMQV